MFFSHKFIVFSLILFGFFSSVYAEKDLEEITQDFVIKTKKITIPECPHAFNASITKWKGRWLMSFRNMIEENTCLNYSPASSNSFSSDPSSSSDSASNLGLIWLDEEFNPIGNPQFITLDHPNKKRDILTEDARLIVKDESLFIIYSGNKEMSLSNEHFRVYVAKLDHDENNHEGLPTERPFLC